MGFCYLYLYVLHLKILVFEKAFLNYVPICNKMCNISEKKIKIAVDNFRIIYAVLFSENYLYTIWRSLSLKF